MSGKTPYGIAIPLLATEAAQPTMLTEAATVTGQQTAPGSPNSRLFTEEELEAARRQEKDKLYPKLEKLEQELRSFQEEREAAERAARDAAEKEAQERKAREEAELSAKELLMKKEDEWNQKFNNVASEWEQRLQAVQEEAEAHKAALEMERRFQSLESYKNRRLAEEQDNIMPELLDLVRGNNEEEIDAAISAAVTKTSAIMSSIQQSLPQQQQRLRGISSVGSTPSGPLENMTEQQVLTTADIANMSMEQYAQVRDRLLAATSRRG
jgi:hypothetical protein